LLNPCSEALVKAAYAKMGIDYDFGVGNKTFREVIEDKFKGSGFDAYGRKVSGESSPYGRVIDA